MSYPINYMMTNQLQGPEYYHQFHQWNPVYSHEQIYAHDLSTAHQHIKSEVQSTSPMLKRPRSPDVSYFPNYHQGHHHQHVQSQVLSASPTLKRPRSLDDGYYTDKCVGQSYASNDSNHQWNRVDSQVTTASVLEIKRPISPTTPWTQHQNRSLSPDSYSTDNYVDQGYVSSNPISKHHDDSSNHANETIHTDNFGNEDNNHSFKKVFPHMDFYDRSNVPNHTQGTLIKNTFPFLNNASPVEKEIEKVDEAEVLQALQGLRGVPKGLQLQVKNVHALMKNIRGSKPGPINMNIRY